MRKKQKGRRIVWARLVKALLQIDTLGIVSFFISLGTLVLWVFYALLTLIKKVPAQKIMSLGLACYVAGIISAIVTGDNPRQPKTLLPRSLYVTGGLIMILGFILLDTQSQN